MQTVDFRLNFEFSRGFIYLALILGKRRRADRVIKMERILILCALLLVTVAVFLKGNAAEDVHEFEIREVKPQEEALQLHNKMRRIHNAPAMSLDSEMSARATAYAEKLARIGRMQHASRAERKGNGENLAYGCKYGASEGLSVEQAVNMWYREVCDYDFNRGGFSGATGHFTQLVWKGSKKLGFGMASTKKGKSTCTYVVARYNPAGNFGGRFGENVEKGSYNGCICKRGADIDCNSGGSGGGGGRGSGGEKCVDESKGCSGWKRYCQYRRYEGYMKKYCSKTCKLCGSGGNGRNKVDGKFSSWGRFGVCSKTCGPGTQSRRRTCSNPPPRNGGRNCVGNTIESRNCNTRQCPVIREQCVNKDNRCNKWNKYCGTNSYVRRNCKKFCGLCGGGGGNGGGAVGGGSGSKECVDKDARCKGWNKYCKRSNYVRARCKKFCGLCGGGSEG